MSQSLHKPYFQKETPYVLFSLDFENNLDGLFDTGAITCAISEADLKEIKLLSNEAMKETGPAPTFQTKVI